MERQAWLLILRLRIDIWARLALSDRSWEKWSPNSASLLNAGRWVLGEVSAGMPPPKTWGFLWSNFPNFFPQKISHREGPNENPSFKETVPHGLKPMFAWMIYMRWGFYSDETKSDVWSRYLSSHVHPFVSMRIIVIYPSQATSTAQSSSAAVTKRFVLLSFVWWWCLQS